MNARVEQLTAPLRWLVIPAVGVAVAAAIVESLRRRARQPTLGLMSDQWIREHTADRALDDVR
ncbi:MAG TPA: hypothetical protein VL173_15640 [Vicinamibacterales bacterium]|jgi:hypothetical protein|nr:hypothetical protein [Vicinamibacterales bacterium]